MNKKNLSVVMAGAMLATSVAPVLAAESTDVKEYKVSVGEWDVVKKQIEDTMKKNRFKTTPVLSDAGTTNQIFNANKYFDATSADEMVAVQSKYGFAEADAEPSFAYETTGKTTTSNVALADSNTVFKTGGTLSNIQAGDTISVYEWTQTSDFFGIKIPALMKDSKISLGKYSATNLEKKSDSEEDKYDSDNGLLKQLAYAAGKQASGDNITEGKKLINSVTYHANYKSSGKPAVVIKLNAYKNLDDLTSNKEIVIKEGSEVLDFNMPLDKDGKLIDVNDPNEVQNFNHFANVKYSEKGYTNSSTSLKYKKVATIKVTAEPVDNGEFLNLTDLYDGVLLTAKGSELANEYNYYKTVLGSNRVEVGSVTDSNSDGIYELEVTFKQSDGSALLKKKTVISTDKTKLTQFKNIIENGSKLGVIGGTNRYETAVQVALKSKLAINNTNAKNIVLVNGESLVDGLTAAPLSAKVNAADGGGKAPILLTKTDSLPKETKDYILKATDTLTVKQRGEITVNLVGGRSVLSDKLVKEIESMGFKVARFGGEDREATSLKVANAIGGDNLFVVGGNGEADAMSISSVAADKTNTLTGSAVTPIIVSSVHGLTTEALDLMASKNGKVTIVGGTGAVSSAEEEAINKAKESQSKGVVERVAGANRFETNAKVIEKYYTTNLNNKIVAITKDGVNNKSELVDSLSAATLGGPIALASSEVKDVQKNALKKASLGGVTSAEIQQIGLGTSDSIIRNLAELLKITN